MLGIAKLFGFAQVCEGTLDGLELLPQGLPEIPKSISPEWIKSPQHTKLCVIAQTAQCSFPNVEITLCALVRGEQQTLRMGRKR
ncbi:MAG: hypothetical protein WBE74_05895 [Terracidiphilus sp.]